ncbi:MAG: hypothetical protein IPO85_00135 [Saprospiraceae bacterium]|uniref:Lipoprotein n=1 Tax=Candidatus Defluviibacterium haderslevense TaxID=2981993 RepID=A0A9D7S691_9BACT|nr:hypothetical protein [Candidatus Defluviibacterium haderslevense]
MKNILKNFLLLAVMGLLVSCGDLSKKIEEKLNELSNKTDHLDSLVNKEFDKVKSLDSLINFESDKIKALDSLVNKSSSRLDSIAKDKFNALKKIMN